MRESRVFVSIREWHSATPRTHPQLAGLCLAEGARLFVEKSGGNRQLEIVEARDGLHLHTFDFAGILTLPLLGGASLVVTISPKVGADTTATFLLYALGLDAGDLRPNTSAPLQVAGLIDVLGYIFLNEVEQIFIHGLLHDYRQEKTWLSAPKGQICFGDLARHPPTARLAVPCRFSIRKSDIPLNQLMQATLRRLARLVQSPRLRFALLMNAETLSEFCESPPLDLGLWEAARKRLLIDAVLTMKVLCGSLIFCSARSHLRLREWNGKNCRDIYSI